MINHRDELLDLMNRIETLQNEKLALVATADELEMLYIIASEYIHHPENREFTYNALAKQVSKIKNARDKLSK